MAWSINHLQLEMSFSGSTTLNGGNVEGVDLEHKELSHVVSAAIDKYFPLSDEQLLEFEARNKPTSPSTMLFTHLRERVQPLDRITLKPEVAKAIQFTARVFTSYENPWKKTVMPDGTWQNEQRVRREDHIVHTDYLTELEPGKFYRLKVRIDDEELRATFVEVDENLSDAERETQSRKLSELSLRKFHQQMGLSLMHQGANNLGRAMAGAHPGEESNRAADSLGGLVQTLEQEETAPGDSELDHLDLAELQRRYDAAQEELEAAREGFQEACKKCEQDKSVDENIMFTAMAQKNAIAQKVMKLAYAIERKGGKPTLKEQPPTCAQQ